MDYLEYQNFLAHGKIYVSHDGGPKTALKNQTTFGARIKKRLAGAKAAGSKMFGGGGSGGSVGGKSGRKWKNHKYIAIVNGRYIYPGQKLANGKRVAVRAARQVKQAAREEFTTAGREAKRVRLSRDAGRTDSQFVTAKAQNDRAYAQQHLANNARHAAKTSKDKRDIGRAEEKYQTATAQEAKTRAEMKRSADANAKAQASLERAKHRTIGETYRAIRSSAKGTDASSATKQKETVRFASKANLKKPGTKTMKTDISAHKKAATTHKPKTQETKASQEKLPDRRNLIDKLKENNPRFGQLGPDPEKVREALNKKKKKK